MPSTGSGVEHGLVDPAVLIKSIPLLGAIGARNPPALTGVVEPLPIEIDRDDRPEPDGQSDNQRRDRHRRHDAEDEKAALHEAFSIEPQARVGRHDVVIAEEPEVDDQDRPEQFRPKRDDEPGEDGKGRNADDEAKVKALAAQPVQLELPARNRDRGHCQPCLHRIAARPTPAVPRP